MKIKGRPIAGPVLAVGLVLVLAALIPMTWFEPNQIIFRGDPMVALSPVRFWLERWSLWLGKINLGAESAITTASLIHQFIQAIPAFLGGSDRASEIWHFTFWFVLPGLTMALFIRELADRLKISLWSVPVAVTFYLFNLYRIAMYGDNNHFVVYAVLPLLLYFVTRVFSAKEGWLRPAIGFALSTLLAAQAGTNPPMYLMIWIPVAIYGFTLTILNYRTWKKSLLFWLTAAGLTILVNLFWLVPFVQTIFRQTGLESGGNLNWLADLSKHTSLDRVIRLIGAWAWFDTWRGEEYAPYAKLYATSPWFQLTLVPALLALLFIFFRMAWNRYVIAILLIGLIGIVFAQGTHPPFGSIFSLAATHLPFFWIFRSPWYKFTNLIAFSYAALIGLGVGYLLTKLQSKFSKQIGWIILPVVLILPIIIAHPLLTGRFWLKAQDVSNLAPDLIDYPTHIKEAADWLNDQPGDTGVALLPYQGAAIYRWGYAAPMDPLYYMSRRPLFFRGDRIGYVPGETPGATIAYRVFVERLYAFDPIATDIARLLGIEYVVERNDIKYEFYDDKDSPEFIKDRLAAMPDLRLARSFKDWDIYQIANAKPNPLFATNWAVEFAGHPVDGLASLIHERPELTEPFPAILFTRPVKQPNPEAVATALNRLKTVKVVPSLDIKRSFNEYTIRGQADQPFLLVLNQTYDPSWVAESRDATIAEPIIANGFAPAWLVEPKGDFTIKVHYKPQAMVFPLVAISGLGSLFLFITFIRLRPKNEESEK